MRANSFWPVARDRRDDSSIEPLNGTSMAWLEIDDSWNGDERSRGGPIRLMHHDARWRQEFEQTRSSILLCCDGRVSAVHHIGGTALPGLIARPVIDLVATVDAGDDLDVVQACIEGLNYRVVDGPDWAANPITLEKPRHGETTHRVMLTLPNSTCRQQAAAIRDHFRQNREAAMSFEQWKVECWRDTQGDPAEYDRVKSAYFDQLQQELKRTSRD